MSDYTPTFILTWNPNIFKWDNYEDFVEISKMGFENSMNWSCRSKLPKCGDRFILLMQGMGARNGVVGYGEIIGSPYELPFADWGGRFVDIRVKRMWNYKTDKYVRTGVLTTMFPEQCFKPQFSGIKVKSSILPDLWKIIEG